MTHEATIQGIAVGMSDEGMGAPVVLLEARNEIIPILALTELSETVLSELCHNLPCKMERVTSAIGPRLPVGPR